MPTTTASPPATRRELHFRSLDELSADLDTIDRAHAAGTIATAGDWTAAQCFFHLARFWQASFDGFPPDFKAPLPIRLLVQLFFKRAAVNGAAPKPGMKIPKTGGWYTPPADADFAASLAELRACVDRARNGDAYIPASPLFGKLTQDQWTTINLGHCSLHLSFVLPGDQA